MPKEYLPALTSDSKFYVEDREVIHAAGTTHYAAHVLTVCQGKIFLQRRGNKPKRNPHCWTSTASGHIEQKDMRAIGAYVVTDDVATEAATRELKEELKELGLERPLASDETPLLLGKVVARSVSDDGDEKCNAISYVFLSRLREPLPDIELPPPRDGERQEVEALRQFPIAELLALLPARRLAGYGIADNFEPIFGIARETLSDE